VEVPPQVPPPFSLLAVNPDSVSPLVAIPSLILLSALVVLWSGYKIPISKSATARISDEHLSYRERAAGECLEPLAKVPLNV